MAVGYFDSKFHSCTSERLGFLGMGTFKLLGAEIETQEERFGLRHGIKIKASG